MQDQEAKVQRAKERIAEVAQLPRKSGASCADGFRRQWLHVLAEFGYDCCSAAAAGRFPATVTAPSRQPRLAGLGHSGPLPAAEPANAHA